MADKSKENTIRTKNIKKTIWEYASNRNLSISECDFSINSIETYIRDIKDPNFRLMNEDVNQRYSNKNDILNEHVELKQFYNISIIEHPNPELKLNYSIDFGENATHPKIVIHHDSEIPYQTYKPKELYILITKEINKIKAENSILVNIFNETMTKNIKAFIHHLYAGKFTKRVKLSLFDGIEPETTKEGKLIFWFLENNRHNQVIEVEEGELLVEFKKPLFGKNGFNSHGEAIRNGYMNNAEDLQAKVDEESIEIIEEKTKKFYKSKKKGYVDYDGESLSISNQIKMNKLSRNNDAVASQEKNNIEVLIAQHDTNRDSVGEGVKLTSETVHITGHVGAHSVIEAANLAIDGATHKDSTQFAKFAAINRHKGVLRCHDAKITLLEGGEVHATNVYVEASLGGSIYAQNVIIDHVKNNLKVYASNSIKIKLISGEDNILKINYRDIPVLVSKINSINRDVADLKESLESAKRNNLAEVPIILNKIKEFKKEYEDIKHSSKEATITIEKPLRGLNTIIFTIDNEHEIVYKTEAHKYEPFHLSFSEDKITLHPSNKTIKI